MDFNVPNHTQVCSFQPTTDAVYLLHAVGSPDIKSVSYLSYNNKFDTVKPLIASEPQSTHQFDDKDECYLFRKGMTYYIEVANHAAVSAYKLITLAASKEDLTASGNPFTITLLPNSIHYFMKSTELDCGVITLKLTFSTDKPTVNIVYDTKALMVSGKIAEAEREEYDQEQGGVERKLFIQNYGTVNVVAAIDWKFVAA